jgi:transcriptional regulator with XRE-family HTH domain
MCSLMKVALGNRIRKARETRGLSRQALADAIGMSLSAVAMIEGGFRLPSLELLFTIGRVLDVEPAKLIRGLPTSTEERDARKRR